MEKFLNATFFHSNSVANFAIQKCYVVGDCIHQSLLSHKLNNNNNNDGFQTLNCHCSFGIQFYVTKFCVALVTRYDLPL